MEKEIYLYPYSAAEARTRNELALWRASYQANEECARDIEEHIRTHFDGAHLERTMSGRKPPSVRKTVLTTSR